MAYMMSCTVTAEQTGQFQSIITIKLLQYKFV